MLAKAVLIITIINSNSTKIDYAFYEDLYNCNAVAAEIMAHAGQRANKEEKISCVCAKIEEATEDV